MNYRTGNIDMNETAKIAAHRLHLEPASVASEHHRISADEHPFSSPSNIAPTAATVEDLLTNTSSLRTCYWIYTI